MKTRWGAIAGGLGFLAALIGLRAVAPAQGPGEVSSAAAGALDAGLFRAARLDGGPADAGTAIEAAPALQVDGGPGQQADTGYRELQARLAELESQVEKIRDGEARTDESRLARLALLDQARVGLEQADALLVRGVSEAADALARIEAQLDGTLAEAEGYATGVELAHTQRAREEVRGARSALGRRDFYEAMRLTHAALADVSFAVEVLR